MKKSYHICFTSHDEVMFRNEEDHGMFVNLMALRGYATGSEWLMDAEMSTHAHLNAFTDCPVELGSTLRMSYTKWFNHRHSRKGRMGQKGCYILEVNGLYHQMALENYVARNGLHHGASPSAFGYPYCSTRELFSGELGFTPEPVANFSRSDISSILPRHSEFPDHWQMNESGVFVRRSFMEIKRAEHCYGTPRNYLFQMNRLTSEDWINDQTKDNTGPPITLQLLENADSRSLEELLRNETGKHFRPDRLQDQDVCRLIDKTLLKGTTSVYQLTDTQKRRIFRILLNEFRLPVNQICRCLACDPF